MAGENYFGSLQSDLEAAGEDAAATGGANAVLRVGDCVQMQPRGEIVHLTALWESLAGQRKAEVRYFCRADAALSPKELIKVDPVATAQTLERVSLTHCNGSWALAHLLVSFGHLSSWSQTEWAKST